jgi:hypothetical protein
VADSSFDHPARPPRAFLNAGEKNAETRARVFDDFAVLATFAMLVRGSTCCVRDVIALPLLTSLNQMLVIDH